MSQFDQIHMHETGTIAGIDRHTNIERTALSEKDSERLDQAIQALGFFDVVEPESKGGVISDAAEYDLTITRYGIAYSIHVERPPNNSAALLTLINLIREVGQAA